MIWRIRSMSLRARFVLASMAVIVLVTTLMGVLVLHGFRRALDAETQKRGEDLARRLEASAQLALRTGSRERLARIAGEELAAGDVVAVEFVDVDGGKLARRELEGGVGTRTMVITRPLRRLDKVFRDEMDLYAGASEEPDGELLGAVSVKMSLAGVDRVVKSASVTIFAAGGALALLAILLSASLARRVTDPIARLAEGAKQIGDGRLDVEIEVGAGGEIGELADHFNLMSRNLKLSMDQMIQQEKMASLGRMASYISHEVGSPLNSIMFDARIILDEVEDGDAAEAGERIAEQTRRMRDTIRNLLNYARTPSGKMEEVDLERALDESLSVLAAPIRRSGVTVELDFEQNTPKIQAIHNLVVQVFINLISNAIAAAGDGGTLVVRSGPTPSGNGIARTARVCFIDSGPGVPGDCLESIFEPFYTTKPEGEGTGLGLSICRHIMEILGGSIEVERAEGKETKFILVFQSIK